MTYYRKKIPARSMNYKLGVPLMVAFILGLGWYVYPLRQQAIYWNECVEQWNVEVCNGR